MKSPLLRPHRAFSIVLVALLVVASGALTAPAADAAPKSGRGAEGIDVSHWQGTINWARVAGAKKTWAFIKATEGTAFLDPLWATNRAGARAAGIAPGAYHFARPDATAGDAVTEARWFVSNISPIRSSELRPALDLERSGGLSVAALQRWTLDFLNEVYRLTGRRPFVFTTNSFWRNYMGDTTAVARAGYRLWISYGEDTRTPRVPADNWGGYGWSFWKYDNCGSVPGISGCVDLGKSNGFDLTPYLAQ